MSVHAAWTLGQKVKTGIPFGCLSAKIGKSVIHWGSEKRAIARLFLTGRGTGLAGETSGGRAGQV